MQLIAPDILAEVARLSFPAVVLGFALGGLIWTTGWMKRTFWFALAVTTGFGIYGLSLGKATGTHPLVTAVLLGVSAGLLSLELGRLIAFITGGLAMAVALQTFVPSFPEPLLAYLAGGLICVILFRLWVLTVFGFAGTMILMHTGLILAARFLRMDVFTLAQTKAPLLNALVVAGTIAGIVVQSRFETYIATRSDRFKSKAMDMFSAKERAALESANASASKKRLFGLMKPKQVA